MRLVQDVLIGFVTTSDPASERGPANIFTVAKAYRPQVAYFLHTRETKPNFQSLCEWFAQDPDLRETMIVNEDWLCLDLPDITDYGKLAELLPPVLEDIGRRHPGANFHLVSGLPQVRIVFALSVFAQCLPGAAKLWEVVPPVTSRPSAFVAPPFQPLSAEECAKRLKVWPTAIFGYFDGLLHERYQRFRLTINVRTEQAWLDNALLDLRARPPKKGEPGVPRPRTFQLLLLLAAKKRYGGGEDMVTKALVKRLLYNDQHYANVNIPRALESLNRQAARLTEKSARGPLPHLVEMKRGVYRLTGRLAPAAETIHFVGGPELLREYLRNKVGIREPEMRSLFPGLPAS